jgi:hypothetical protein
MKTIPYATSEEIFESRYEEKQCEMARNNLNEDEEG